MFWKRIDLNSLQKLQYQRRGSINTMDVPLSTTNIQAFVNAQPAGTEFVFLEGTYRFSNSITPRTGDSFVGSIVNSRLVSVINGSRVLEGWTFDGTRMWYKDGVTEDGSHGAGIDACAVPIPQVLNSPVAYPGCVYPNDLYIDDVPVNHVESLSDVRPGTWYLDYAADRAYMGDNPNGRLVEISTLPYLFTQNVVGVSNVTVESLIIEKYASPVDTGAVNLGYSPGGSANWEVRYSEIRLCHSAGVGMDAQTQCRYNYIHHNLQYAIIGAGLDVVVEGNELAYNNYLDWFNPLYGAVTKWIYTTNLIVRGNYAHHNHGRGLWTDINNITTLYEYNICEYNEWDGIFHEISYDAIIRYNILRYNGTQQPFPYYVTGAGIAICNSRNVEIHDNILEENYQEITGIQDGRIGPGIHGNWELTNLNVHNNTITNTGIAAGGGRCGAETAFAFLQWNLNTYTLSSSILQRWFKNGVNYNQAGWQGLGYDVGSSITFV